VDVITAPVISDGTVYFTNLQWQLLCAECYGWLGVVVKVNAATSAPVIANGQLYETRKSMAGTETIEGLARVDAKQGNARDKRFDRQEQSEYLKEGNGGGVALSRRR